MIPAGNVQEIVPDPVPGALPITVGPAKEPDASESCTVNTLPALKTSGVLKAMDTVALPQTVSGAMGSTVIWAMALHTGKAQARRIKLRCFIKGARFGM